MEASNAEGSVRRQAGQTTVDDSRLAVATGGKRGLSDVAALAPPNVPAVTDRRSVVLVRHGRGTVASHFPRCT